MTEFPFEDDRKKFIKFMNGRKVNRLDIDLLDDARSVVLNRKFSHATRLAAAKLLVCKENDDNNKKFLSQPFLDWVLLTAMLEESDTDRKVLAKKGNDFKKRLTVSELKVLHR
uniref:TerB domain-containing protein n=1 Tax=Angiostrongylus cantonensis TaxID=6313 RepID=A0A0K0DQW4_ANGCA